MAAPLFRRGDVICQKYYVLTKSGEAALWVGYLACTVDTQQAAEGRGEVPEPDLLLKVVRPELLESVGAAEKLVRHLQQFKELSHPLQPMQKSTNRLLRLSDQLLEFRKKQNDKLALS